MGPDIAFRLRAVQMRQDAAEVDPLPDSRIPLEAELIPEFCLADKHQRHWAHGIKPVIQQEPEFLNGLPFQQVCLIKDTHHLLPLYAADDLHFLLQLPFGIAAVNLASTPSWSSIPL